MSLRCMSWVFSESAADGFARLVLLAIADEADDDGGNAYPSQQRIADKAHVSKRTVQRALAELESAGELLIERPEKKGRGYFWTYTVLMGRDPVAVQEGRAARLFSVGRPETATKGAEGRAVLPETRQTLDPVTTTPPTPPAVSEAVARMARTELENEQRKGTTIASEPKWLNAKKQRLMTKYEKRMRRDLETDPSLTPDRLIALVLNAPYRRAWENDLQREVESA